LAEVNYSKFSHFISTLKRNKIKKEYDFIITKLGVKEDFINQKLKN